MFISPKWKNAILKMALKSFIISKLDHQMSKRWNKIAAHAFETTYYQIWQDEKLSTWLLSSGQDFRKNNQMHWLQYDRKHFSIFFYLLFLLRPSVLGAGHGQNYKASNMKRNHYGVCESSTASCWIEKVHGMSLS